MGSRPYSERLRLANRVTEPAIRQAIRELALPEGSVGLDAGCGIGERTLWLAEAVGPHGKVTGLDISTDNLTVARELSNQSPVSGLVDFAEGDLLHLPFEDDSFDWAWCADVLWPAIMADAPTVGIGELARVVRSGGTVAVLYWSSQNLLPGHPTLEARLNSAFAAATPYLGSVPPDHHFLRALGWLKATGLEQPVAHSFVADIRAPLNPELREAVAFCFSMFWGNLQSHVSNDDWDAYLRLCDPDSKEFILHNADYYGFLTYTLFSGRVAS